MFSPSTAFRFFLVLLNVTLVNGLSGVLSGSEVVFGLPVLFRNSLAQKGVPQ